MKLASEPLRRSDFVAVDVSEARTARIWSGVSARLNQRRRWPWFLGAGIAAGAAALILVLISPSGPAAGKDIVSGRATVLAAQQARQVVLGDGSELGLAPRTQVVVAKQEERALELELEDGVLTCEVSHVPGRRFVVHAGEVKVIVVGTRFRVSRNEKAAAGVAVDVERGIVEVHSGDRVERLGAGQHWESIRPARQIDTGRPEATDPSSSRTAARHAAPEQSRAPSPSGSVAAEETPERADARKLFETANHARRAGDMRAAAASYEALLRQYPADGRATLAAFELGRLRMDHLGDNAGAISALNRAASSGGGSVREDAMARLVRAYAATGSRERCLRARENYERSYPEGHHRAEVRAACGPRSTD